MPDLVSTAKFAIMFQNFPSHLGNFLCDMMSLLKGHIILMKDYTFLMPISCDRMATTLFFILPTKNRAAAFND